MLNYANCAGWDTRVVGAGSAMVLDDDGVLLHDERDNEDSSCCLAHVRVRNEGRWAHHLESRGGDGFLEGTDPDLGRGDHRVEDRNDHALLLHNQMAQEVEEDDMLHHLVEAEVHRRNNPFEKQELPEVHHRAAEMEQRAQIRSRDGCVQTWTLVVLRDCSHSHAWKVHHWDR